MSAWEGSEMQRAWEEQEKAGTVPKAPEENGIPEPPPTKPAPRASWDRYFMDLAQVVSSRGTCDRKKVGAALVRGKRVVATGYNGALPGLPHCDEVGHDLIQTLGPDGKPAPNCVRTVHAEANAVSQAARYGVALEGATAYVNTYPCWPCFRLLATAGIVRVVYSDAYRLDARVEEAARALGIKVERID